MIKDCAYMGIAHLLLLGATKVLCFGGIDSGSLLHSGQMNPF